MPNLLILNFAKDISGRLGVLQINLPESDTLSGHQTPAGFIGSPAEPLAVPVAEGFSPLPLFLGRAAGYRLSLT